MERHKKSGNDRKHTHFQKNQPRRFSRGPDQSVGKGQVLTGTIKAIRGNVAYFIANDKKTEVEISTRQLKTAMSGDTVEVAVYFKKNKAGKMEGEVSKIISRAKTLFVGTIEISPKGIQFIPDDRKLKLSVFIPKEKLGKTQDKDKVRVKITKWVGWPNNSEAEIVTILGKKGDNSTEMNSMALDRGFEYTFPEKVLAEAKKIFSAYGGSAVGREQNLVVPMEEIAKRRDKRDTLTFTIDPATAKDFDDAISFKKLPNNNYEIGVHIADVSHYVKEKSELDKEAYKRGCSVYLPDRTIPMLPFELSDELCSLNENEDKLAFSAVFEIDQKAQVHSKWFGRTIINSNKRFTYETAQDAINNPSAQYHAELTELNRLAKLLQKEKWQKGAIDFEQEEIAFELDATGKPIRIYKKQHLDTHKLVEQYMLLANKEVAEFVYKAEKKSGKSFPLPYRIHDFPDRERISELAIFVKALGHELVIGKNGSITGKDMQALFAQVEGKAEEALVKTAAIRSMSKAIYSVKNIGHFGLAFEYYAHFTSPIRRYPDMLVHRMLANILSEHALSEKNISFYENACSHSTEQEIKAAEAERDGRKYKQIEYMLDKVGQTFNGQITGVAEWGIYAEDTETKAEGMIKLSSLEMISMCLIRKSMPSSEKKIKKCIPSDKK